MSAFSMYLGLFALKGANVDITSATGLTGQVSWTGLSVGLLGSGSGVLKVTNGGSGYGTIDCTNVRIDGNGMIFGTGIFGRVATFSVNIVSDGQFKMSSGSDSFSGLDTGMARHAAGVVKFTNASTAIRGFAGGGTAVASATAMPLPTGRVFHVTGTTAITSITSTNFASGAVITLIFDDVLTFTDGNNLKLVGNFTTAANSTITLAYDGTNWFELSRSAPG